MNETTLAALGIAASLLNAAGLLPYLRDILRHKTKPERATWWVWFAITTVGFFAQWAGGARWSLLLTLSSAIDVGIIAVLSIPFGYGTFHQRDTISLVVAGIGIAVSLMLRSPLLAVLVVVCVDLTGAWLTIVKVWVAAHTETLIAWELSFVAALCGLLAVGAYYPARFLYPLYGVITNRLITLTVMYRRRKVIRSPLDL
jgi:hypothetical protein